MEFAPGETVVEVFSCERYIVSDIGEVDVKMHEGRARVLVPEGDLRGAGLCEVD
jgi:hypothetical protein